MSALVHPYMLLGLVLAGVPVLIHLLMRQKPKTLAFPAFRFLVQRHLRNRRKLRLQHLLLLLLRMAVVAGLCLPLGRPRLAGGPWAIGAGAAGGGAGRRGSSTSFPTAQEPVGTLPASRPSGPMALPPCSWTSASTPPRTWPSTPSRSIRLWPPRGTRCRCASPCGPPA